MWDFSSVQFISVAQSCPTLCDPMDHSTPGLPDHYQLPEFTQTHVHWVRDAIQPSHPLSSPFPPVPNPSQHQSLDTIKLLEENIGRTLSNINRSNIFFFFSPSPRIMEIKTRINKQDLLKRFCTAKETKNKKTAFGIGENICKQRNQHGVNLQNIQTAHAAQYKNKQTNNSIKKWEVKWSESCSVVFDSLQPHGLYSPWTSPDKNTGVGSLSLLQDIFPTQGLNPGLPHCRLILY